ncbi:MAG: EpsG family protein [Ruminococcaceae bacterium]|nr:EpsG family protein [Oscillospiraceae bacterium]MBE6707201.1 EpsG family protein [Oscillospiraceae bacterium]
MIYYVISALFPLAMWFLYYYITKENRIDDKQKIKLRNALTVISILPMFLLFVLRYKYVGNDTIGYVRFFENEIRTYSFQDLLVRDEMRVEMGYRIYVKIVSLFTDNYTVFFLINGIVIFGTLLHFAKKYTENPFVFFFLFMTLGTYSFVETGLRQALAMMICLWSIDFLKNKKIIRFLLLVTLAYFFHQSALIFILMLPLSFIKKYDWMILTHILMAIVFFAGFTAFHEFFNEWLGYEYNIEETGNGLIFLMLVSVLFIFSLFMMYDKPNEVDGQPLIVHLSLLTVIFWLLRLVSRTAERVSYYYILGLYAYFAQATKYEKDKLSTLLKWLLIAACFILFFYRNPGTNYLFFWQMV